MNRLNGVSRASAGIAVGIAAVVIVSVGVVVSAAVAQGDVPQANAVDAGPEGDLLALLPGFDQSRLAMAAGIVPMPPSAEAVETAAKLLWAVRRLRPEVIETIAQGGESLSDSPAAGRASRVQGRARSVDAIRVPDALAERLELDRLYRVVVETDAGVVRIIAAEVPQMWAQVSELNEPVEATGLAVAGGPNPLIFAAHLRWSPDAASGPGQWPAGWQLLASSGFDCGLLAGVAQRNKKPLLAGDNRPFYEMLGIAHAIADEPAADIPSPQRMEVARVLREPRELVGHWVEMDLQLARVSRVLLSSDEARQRLGHDAYWQIDGFADLGDVQIALERTEEEEGGQREGAGEPLLFVNRFPVTLAVAELPQWLEEQVGSGGSRRIDMSMVREDATIHGFFYRLWSYDSEYTDSRGGRQVAPLILVSSILPRGGVAPADGGIDLLGWGLATLVLVGIVGTVVFTWWTSRRDRAVLQRRRV